MNDQPDQDSYTTSEQRPAIVAPALTWTAVQMLALGLSAARAQLWARGSQPGEQFALECMIVAQAMGSALLFPWLMRGMRLSVFVIALAGPFIYLSGILAGAPSSEIADSAALVWGWLIGLGLWSNLLTTSAARTVAAAVMGLLVVGGAAWAYLWIEFGGGAPSRLGLVPSMIAAMPGAIALVLSVWRISLAKLSTNSSTSGGENGKLDNIG
jgi:hypothetical protein